MTMAARNIVHVVGTGTIGEPLVGLLAQHKRELGLEEVTFYKHSPKPEHRPMVQALQRKGARMAVADEKRKEFEAAGFRPEVGQQEALQRAKVIIDCTPGEENFRDTVYKPLDDGSRMFLAQGGQEGTWGKPYALGINDEALTPEDRFVQVVSCNTHNISALIKALAFQGTQSQLTEGRFVCIRRGSDVGEDKVAAAPSIDKHKESHGTHHATDVHGVFKTLGLDLPIFSSALKLNTQYMHTIWFDLKLKQDVTKEQVARALKEYPYLAVTEKKSTNQVFAFGREYGPFGRILNQGVVSLPSLSVRGKEIVGFCFTPQDGNVLLTNIALVARALHGGAWRERMKAFEPYLFREC
jgi:glyceraldehyde-3-phosphate dehydrogenase (NAD(P))